MFSNFLWTLAGNGAQAASQWGVVVLLAKVGSPELVGQYALGVAIAVPVIMFANLQLRAIQATDAGSQYSFGDYLGLRLLSLAAAFGVIVAILLAAGHRIDTKLAVMGVAASRILDAVSDVFYGLFQRHERMDRIAGSMLWKAPISLLALGLAVHLTRSVFWATVSITLVYGVVLVAYDIPNGMWILKAFGPVRGGIAPRGGSGILPRFRPRTLARIARLALPLGVTMMLLSLVPNIHRYFIQRYFGERELGLFAAIAYLPMAGGVVIRALGEAASPRLARDYAMRTGRGTPALLVQLLLLAGLTSAAGFLLALVAGRGLLVVFYGPDYARHHSVLLILSLAEGLSCMTSVIGYAATASRRILYQPLVLSSTVTAMFFASYCLVPRVQLIGAALSVMVGAIVSAAGHALLLWKAAPQHR